MLHKIVPMLVLGSTFDMQLYLMKDEVSEGAMCLDGTPTGFYHRTASNASNVDDWEIYFEGGGWCYDEMDCYGRAQTSLGSSKDWANGTTIHGLMNPDCHHNPDFCNFNRVKLSYCDGTSFSGDVSTPITVNNTALHFKGKQNMISSFNKLLSMGLGSAKRVVLTGCSAGALASILHANWVGDFLKKNCPNLETFRVVPMSGFFLNHDNIEKQPIFADEIRNMVNLTNSVSGLDPECLAGYGNDSQKWNCFFPQNALPHVQHPVFLINSGLDYWQTICIYLSQLFPNFPNQTKTGNGRCNSFGDYHHCGQNPDMCNQTQIVQMNQYMTDFSGTLEKTGFRQGTGGGAFIHSCHTHCEAQTPDFVTFSVSNYTMQEAVSKWWAAPSTTPTSDNLYDPCHYLTGPSPPRSCNPTCGASYMV
eukprot:TRINITY_DN6773_c0_g1_i1.p1 TRINITY_DN6773_c0_g1~~TRINITY_DN6773_c0_g1_i1.p1  ORF type:complete len:442 (+),score=72.56 TRINITY_DN6773_c0_g1_i1:70-1326(+)